MRIILLLQSRHFAFIQSICHHVYIADDSCRFSLPRTFNMLLYTRDAASLSCAGLSRFDRCHMLRYRAVMMLWPFQPYRLIAAPACRLRRHARPLHCRDISRSCRHERLLRLRRGIIASFQYITCRLQRCFCRWIASYARDQPRQPLFTPELIYSLIAVEKYSRLQRQAITRQTYLRSSSRHCRQRRFQRQAVAAFAFIFAPCWLSPCR